MSYNDETNVSSRGVMAYQKQNNTSTSNISSSGCCSGFDVASGCRGNIMHTYANDDETTKTLATRYGGLDQVKFAGHESMPSSKFSLILGDIRQRIQNERNDYSTDEIVMAANLLQIANNLELLYVSQDSPLYSTQFSPAVHIETYNMFLNGQEVPTLDKFPEAIAKEYERNYLELSDNLNERDKLLGDFACVDLFMREVDYDNGFEFSCLLGVTQRVRKSLDILSEFNSMISVKFKEMLNNVDEDKIFNVDHVLGNIDSYEKFHESRFPNKRNKNSVGKRDYTKVITTVYDVIDKERRKINFGQLYNDISLSLDNDNNVDKFKIEEMSTNLNEFETDEISDTMLALQYIRDEQKERKLKSYSIMPPPPTHVKNSMQQQHNYSMALKRHL